MSNLQASFAPEFSKELADYASNNKEMLARQCANFQRESTLPKDDSADRLIQSNTVANLADDPPPILNPQQEQPSTSEAPLDDSIPGLEDPFAVDPSTQFAITRGNLFLDEVNHDMNVDKPDKLPDVQPEDVLMEDDTPESPVSNDGVDFSALFIDKTVPEDGFGNDIIYAFGNDSPTDPDVAEIESVASRTDIIEDISAPRPPPSTHPRSHSIDEEEPDELEELHEEDVDDLDPPTTSPFVVPESHTALSLDVIRAELIGSYKCFPNGFPLLHPHGLRELSPSEEASLRHYIFWKQTGGTTKAYTQHAESLYLTSGTKILGLKAVRKLVRALTGIVPKKVDICPNNCLAYTGAFKMDRHCSLILKQNPPASQLTGSMPRKKGDLCGHPRFIPYYGPGKQHREKSYSQMLVIPIFDVIRAMFANYNTAKLMRHRDKVMMEALKVLHRATEQRVYSDFGNGQIQMSLRAKGLFSDPRDCAGAITTDGAMLTLQKQSEVWVALLILFNLPPEARYLLDNIITMFIIPGPWSPTNIESFFYQSFVDMLQASEGIWMYDAYASEKFIFKFHLVGLLGDLIASYKFNAGTGTSGVHADIYTNVEGARPGAKGKRQYIVVWKDALIRPFNPDRPIYNYYNIPLRNEEYFLKVIELLARTPDPKIRQLIARNTGITRIPLFAAATGWTYPTFFPLDCLHQLYANNANHLYRFNLELGVISIEMHKEFGRLLVRAMRTLPGVFSSPIRNIAEKLNTSYKLFEWMGIVHWYIGPFMIELGADQRYTSHFSKFSRIAEISMRPHPFTNKELDDLTTLIIDYLIEHEILYILTVKDVNRARIVLFQLLQIPRIIRAWGSYRSVSQGTCERAIGILGHQVTSYKSPYAHLANIVLEREVSKCLRLLYPNLIPNSAPNTPKPPIQPLVRGRFKFQRHDLQEFSDLSIHLPLISAFTGISISTNDTLAVLNYKLLRWGKYRLPGTGHYLRSRLNESKMKNVTRSARYFERTSDDGTSVFGEALAFYSFKPASNSDPIITVVVYAPIVNIECLWGVWLRGQFADTPQVRFVRDITALIGIWQYKDNTYILRKHAAAAVLKAPDEGLSDI
ncbi:hypothetical protein ONZ45_g11974 [Pleurotus djamor]|nr:hypothetical protein ONZ45_g11974 [Pleurotus djamor]